MKILDWMHRRLHPVSSSYTRLAPRKASAFEEDAGKITVAVHNSQSAAEIEHDTEDSLLHHELEGILSIGTLGHPHPCLLPDHFPEEEEDDDALKLESPKKEPMAAEKSPIKITLLQPPVEMFKVETEQSGKFTVDLAEEKIMTEVPLLKEDREKKERTTLADLLSRESASTGDEPPATPIAGAIKNAITVQIISGASTPDLKSSNKELKMKLNKKKDKEDHSDTSHSSAAAKRIRRIITRMVKKKIHPVAEAGADLPGRNDGGAAAIGVNPLLSHGGVAA